MNFAKKIFTAFKIPYHFIEFPYDNWEQIDLGLRQKLIGKEQADQFWKQFFTERTAEQTIYQFVDLFEFTYFITYLTTNQKWVIVGPIIYNKMPDETILKILNRHHLPTHMHTDIKAQYENIKPVSNEFPILIQVLANERYGENNYQICYERDDDSNDFIQIVNNHFNVPDQPLQNIPLIEQRYQYESELYIAVLNGNTLRAIEYFEKLAGIFFPLRLEDSLRDYKNLCITLNTLLRKAAEQSGVHPIEIDAFSNRNICEIEELTDIGQCRSFCNKTIHRYCGLITSYSLAKYSLPIRKAITYIRTNLSADLSLHTLAKILCVNPSYLSALFKKETNIPLTEYVNQCRIFQARQYLIGTELPIKTIAIRCGISDINYFTRMFKRIIGVTPKACRQNIDFKK